MIVASLSLVITCCVLTMPPCGAKKIIFMPGAPASHILFHADLARVMVDRGHDVWFVLPDNMLSSDRINASGMSVIQYKQPVDWFKDVTEKHIINPSVAGEVDRFDQYSAGCEVIFHSILSNQSLFEQMKQVKADLFVSDYEFAVGRLFLIFPYRLGIPFACLDVMFQPLFLRVPFSPATIPNFFSTNGQHMTFWERFQNTVNMIPELFFYPLNVYNDAIARYAPEMENIPFDKLAARAEVWLITLDPILHLPYPTLPNVKYIGGLAAAPADPLDAVFQSFMDSAKDGVIVVSFGTMVPSLPQRLADKLMAALQQMRPMKVVIRTNMTSRDPTQIVTSSWLPQNSLLAHPNCRVFVTHCGLNGLYQALYHAVPMLGLPLFYDQHKNAQNMERKGFGISMDIKKLMVGSKYVKRRTFTSSCTLSSILFEICLSITVTNDVSSALISIANREVFRQVSVGDLVKALQQLKEDGGYRDNITMASRLFREQYGIPRNTAAYWLEHVMQYGGAYMRSSGQEMALYQFLLVDVLLVLGGCVCVLLGLACLCVRCLWATFCRPSSTREKVD